MLRCARLVLLLVLALLVPAVTLGQAPLRLVPLPATQPLGALPYRGINLSSAEWGTAIPGVHGTDYIYPDPAYASGYNSAAYYRGKSMTAFRVPFRWERLQRTLNGAFDATELTRLQTTVSRQTAAGAYVIIEPHNYARYNDLVIGGGTGVTNAHFADLWSRLATLFKDDPFVMFNLMNEPRDLPTEQWVSAANAAISAIRATGATALIHVPGNGYTGAHSWNDTWYGTSNAVAMLNIVDAGNNVVFEVHQYLDSDSSGQSDVCVSTTIGSQRMAGFTAWLQTNGKRGFLGEVGSANNATCLAAVDDMLDHLEAHTDVYLGWLWWAGGPWWDTASYSLEPDPGPVDKAQMNTLEPHLGPL